MTWENGHYVDHPNGAAGSIITVEKFTRESVILHRTDSGPYPGTAVLTGRISSDGNSVVNGKITWTSHPCCGLSSGAFQAAWGTAIDSVPGGAPEPSTAKAAAPVKQAPSEKQADKRTVATTATKKFTGQLAFDPDGIWQRPTDAPQQPFQKILIVVIENQIVGINIDRFAFLPPGMEYLQGTASSANSFNILAMGTVDTSGITNSKVAQSPTTLTIIDDDHFQIAKSVTFTRVSKSSGGNPACDANNPSHVSGNEALARGLIYDYFLKDARAAVCWYRISADEGNAQGELNTAAALANGVGGVAKDHVKSFAWLQKSAMHGNDLAAGDLSHEFSTGEVVPRSEQRSKYWAARAELNDTRWFHQQVFLPVPSWASDIAGPCDPSHPLQVSSNKTDGTSLSDYKADGAPRSWRGSAQAFAHGRVAYEARALGLAACWFQVAANSPVIDVLPTVADVNQRANVYLGIQYAFGLGVEKNPVRGFEYMKKAADAGDKFGLMYLANFYRYGIGTKPDMNQASALIDKVMKSGEGLDAFMRVQGTLLTGDEALQTAISGLSAIAQGTTCKSEIGGGGVTYLKDCVDHAEQWAVGHMGGRPARHTIDHPEEIWPEHFDAAVPPEFKIEKMSGMPVDRKGRKTP